MKNVRLAIVGAGNMAFGAHRPAILAYQSRFPGALELVAVVDPNADNRARLIEAFGGGAVGFDTVEAMLAVERPDAAMALTPYWLNAQVAVKLLEAGVHVLMEKPCGMNAGETRMLIEVAARTGAMTQVGYNRRHWAALKLGLAWVRESGAPIQYMRGTKHRTGRINEDYAFYTSSHVIDTLLSVNPDPVECLTVRSPVLGAPDAWNFISTIRFADGSTAHATGLPHVSYNQEIYEFHTLAGTVIVNQHWRSGEDADVYEYRDAALFRHARLPKGPDGLDGDGFLDQLATFLAAVRGEGQPYPTVEQCLRSIALSEAIRDGHTWRCDR